MTERERSQKLADENSVLVKLILPDTELDGEPLDELDGLATTAGTTVVGRMTQRRVKPDPSTYLGKGKVEELQMCAEASEADLIIFDNELSPAQTRNLEQAIKLKVIDRTELILDIFATHAQTYESRLAVELAQLEYSLPRLKRMWTHLDRIKMGVGMRGPGEKQLEVDRRLVEKRISDLKNDLKKVQDRREREVSSRRDVMTISLVGYTNAGKSTLMNHLTKADVLVEDKLFATLDTRTRRWRLPHWGPVLLSDTVGFIRNLPHKLIASFKATLSEANQADLLLHIADASSPEVLSQIDAVHEVLEEIGIKAKDTLLVLNKIDKIENRVILDRLQQQYPHALAVSAITGEGKEGFAQTVSDALSRNFRDVDIETGIENGKLLAYLAAHGEVITKTYSETKMIIHCRLPQRYLGSINEPGTIVTEHEHQVIDDEATDSEASDSIEEVA